ncbi:tRNA (adenine37-N(6))-methyltransferase TrmN6 [Hyphomicrobium sulfonivorans]|uniref:tRNA (Adenine37-N(6))-methyltransferase TrmN6 n=1 Tax=Hyphomicrobium sulfonivorans TaxID=121290 RepID=A0A109BKX1_HYPSL|nr:methyltransferase [Hyphomicrobium sulfonivorans]KWT69827.1 tRNA (adenine37-N(6))-methyltransferase TrmN6 [Hyphomicrobium sulfonivorans]
MAIEVSDGEAASRLSGAADAPEFDRDLTDDAFLGGALTLLQMRSGYRAGLDAVMLAAGVAPAGDGALRVLDVGAGVGTAGLCVARRLPMAEVALMEREPELAELAARNIERNDLGRRVRAMAGSVGAAVADLRALGLQDESFSHVIANPPYYDVSAGTLAPDRLKAGAHAMDGDGLERWARFMARMARPLGVTLVVHRADALPQLLQAFGQRFGALTILPLHPRAGEPASRVLMRGVKGSRAPLRILPGFVLHGEGNAFTPEAQEILRNGGPLLPLMGK